MGRKSKKQKDEEAAAAAAVENGAPADPDALTDEEFERYLADQKAQYESDARAKRGAAPAPPTQAPPPPPPVAATQAAAPPPPPPVAATQAAAPPPPPVAATQAAAPPPPPPPPTMAQPAAPAVSPGPITTPQSAPPSPAAPQHAPPQPQAAAPVPPQTPNAPVPQPVVNPNPGYHASAPPHPAMPAMPARTPSQVPPPAALAPVDIPKAFLAPLHPSDAQTQRLTIEEYPLIASGEGAMAAMQFNLAGGFGFSEWQLPRIKVPSGGQEVWSLPGPSGPIGAPSFAGVILYTRDQRTFWSQGYDESGGGSPPDCSSTDGRWGQGNPGGPCAQCPYSQWGSMAQINPRHKDSNGQACRHSTIIFLAMPGMLLPTMLTAPPTSLQLFKRYLFSLAQLGYPYFGVETVFGIHVTRVGTYNVSLINPGKNRVLEIEHRKSVWNATQALMSIFSSITLTRGEIDAS